MKQVKTGLQRLIEDETLQQKIKGNIGLLCHAASLTKDLEIAVGPLKKIFSKRLIKLFGPQHGLVCDVQDNMVETKDFKHPYFDLVVYSLYGETRIPNDNMLEGIDTLIVDLQDVGTRVYTYISTLGLLMKACEHRDIKIIILDRPNPVNGQIIEGNILDPQYKSFVGHFEIPMRHAMTMGEMALFAKKFYYPQCQVDVISMEHWKRDMFWHETQLPWINPSPNLPTPEGALTFVGTVLFEGTQISEGRGTTRSLEIIGAPHIEAFSFVQHLNDLLKQTTLKGFVLRPLNFLPTFQKHANTPCGGLQIHVTNPKEFRPWKLGQFLMRQFYLELEGHFQWNKDCYEYEDRFPAIDYINGSNAISKWVIESGDMQVLEAYELAGRSLFEEKRNQILIYT